MAFTSIRNDDSVHLYMLNQLQKLYGDAIEKVSVTKEHYGFTTVVCTKFKNGHAILCDISDFGSKYYHTTCKMIFDLPETDNGQTTDLRKASKEPGQTDTP